MVDKHIFFPLLLLLCFYITQHGRKKEIISWGRSEEVQWQRLLSAASHLTSHCALYNFTLQALLPVVERSQHKSVMFL